MTAALTNTSPSPTATRLNRRQFHNLADLVASQGLALVGATALSGPLTARDERLLAEAGLRFSRMLDHRSDRWRTRIMEAADAAAPDGLCRREVFAALGGHVVAAEVVDLVARLVGEGQLEQLQGPVSGGRRAVLVRQTHRSRLLA